MRNNNKFITIYLICMFLILSCVCPEGLNDMQKSFMEKQDLARSAFSDRDTFTEEAVVFESDIHIHPGSIIRNTSAEEDHNSRYNIRIVILLLVLTLAIIALLFRYVCYFGLLDIILKWRYIIVYIHNQDGLKKKYLSFHM